MIFGIIILREIFLNYAIQNLQPTIYILNFQIVYIYVVRINKVCIMS